MVQDPKTNEVRRTSGPKQFAFIGLWLLMAGALLAGIILFDVKYQLREMHEYDVNPQMEHADK